jgi:hypothetical protein
MPSSPTDHGTTLAKPADPGNLCYARASGFANRAHINTHKLVALAKTQCG